MNQSHFRGAVVAVALGLCHTASASDDGGKAPTPATEAAPAASAPVPATPAATAGGGPSDKAEPSARDAITIDKILAFLLDRSAHRKLDPGNVAAEMRGFGPLLVDQGKKDPTWDFLGKGRTGLVRELRVSFLPAHTSREAQVPEVWEFSRASFRVHTAAPKAALADFRKKLAAEMTKSKWRIESERGWKVKGNWDLTATLLEDGSGLFLAVTEPQETDASP